MRGPVPLLALMAMLVVAGCVDDPAPQAEAQDEGPDFSYTDDRITFRSIESDAEAWTPTLAEPPQWTLGQWWKVKVTEEFTGSSAEAYVVVAGQEDDFWLVGMPTHDFSNDLMVLHIPGFGQIQKADLAFEAHDVWFKALPFPLEEDATWTTGFEAPDNVECTIMALGELTADVECTGSYHITYTYDATLRQIRTFKIDDYGAYEVIDSGFAFHEDVPELEGTVTVPHMSDLIFFHGRLGPAVQIAPGGGPVMGFGVTPVPLDEVEVDSTYDRVSFSIILGDILGLDLPATLFQETATAPDGQVYQASLTPADGVPLKIVSYKHDAPGGTWGLQHIAAGPGVAFLEGIGYHVYDVELPSGRILPSIGEHQHGSDGGH